MPGHVTLCDRISLNSKPENPTMASKSGTTSRAGSPRKPPEGGQAKELSQNSMERAFGPYILPRDQGLREMRALKARSISAWGEATGTGREKGIKGCKPAPRCIETIPKRRPGYIVPRQRSPGRGDRKSDRRLLLSPLQGSVVSRFPTPGCASLARGYSLCALPGRRMCEVIPPWLERQSLCHAHYQRRSTRWN